MDELILTPVAHIKSDFPTKFGVPRQSGLTDKILSTIEFCPEFRNPDALRGLEGFSHLWLIWHFSQAEKVQGSWSPTVRPPKLGGNKRVGVFATRSPFRPNPIGLSSVKIEKIDFSDLSSPKIIVSGADLVDGTPIFDIKPYLAYTDSHPDAAGGFALEFEAKKLDVSLPENLQKHLTQAQRQSLCAVLEQDPRPAYHDDPSRVYGFLFSGFEVKFTVDDVEKTITVRDLLPFGGDGEKVEGCKVTDNIKEKKK